MAAFKHITKPFEMDDLARQVAKTRGLDQPERAKTTHLTTLEDELEYRTHELEEALAMARNRQDRLDAILQSMNDALIALDSAGGVMLMNKRAEDVLGIRFSAIAGSTFGTAIQDPNLSAQLTTLSQNPSPNSNEPTLLEIRINDAPRSLAARATNLCDENGTRIGTILTLADQTERVLAERMRTSFLTIVSHELRTPVNTLTNYLSCLELLNTNSPVVSDILTDMQKTGRRLGGLIENIITAANLAGSLFDLAQTEFDVWELIDGILEKTVQECQERGTQVKFENRSGPMPFLTDRKVLGISITHLIGNSIKFNRPGGTIFICVEIQPDPRVLHILIRDQGQGVTEEYNGFRGQFCIQGQNPLTRSYGGIGCGLFISNLAAEYIGGSIRVRLIPDSVGTCAEVSVPETAIKIVQDGRVQ